MYDQYVASKPFKKFFQKILRILNRAYYRDVYVKKMQYLCQAITVFVSIAVSVCIEYFSSSIKFSLVGASLTANHSES